MWLIGVKNHRKIAGNPYNRKIIVQTYRGGGVTKRYRKVNKNKKNVSVKIAYGKYLGRLSFPFGNVQFLLSLPVCFIMYIKQQLPHYRKFFTSFIIQEIVALSSNAFTCVQYQRMCVAKFRRFFFCIIFRVQVAGSKAPAWTRNFIENFRPIGGKIFFFNKLKASFICFFLFLIWIDTPNLMRFNWEFVTSIVWSV